MSSTGIPAHDAVDKVLDLLKGLPVFLTGSAAAAVAYDKKDAYSDVDVFVPNPGMYFSAVQQLLNHGFSPSSDRFAKMLRRHRNFGFNHWHTNSMELAEDATGMAVNIIYKRVDGHETTRLSQVLESFDFGLLALGYECETGRWHDMRSYFFGPGAESAPALPLLPYRQESISQGFMSQFLMMRTPGRYARYAHKYDYDLSLVKPTLVEGLLNYATYKADRTKAEDLTLGQIAQALARHIEFDEFDELVAFEAALPKADGLDAILESLE